MCCLVPNSNPHHKMSELVRHNLEMVRGRIEAACLRAGRDTSEVTLVAVSKWQPVEAIRAAAESGQRLFGENYAQHLRDKRKQQTEDVEWDFIGHLQHNKVRLVVPGVRLFHALDSVDLAKEIDRRVRTSGAARLRCLIEVNVGAEPSKAGVAPEDVPRLIEETLPLAGMEVVGLMALPPYSENPEETRPFFRRLATLRDETAHLLGLPLPELSMGMSSDFEVAIEEGATIVRIGTAIFGPRPA